jgi:hypothetical protein
MRKLRYVWAIAFCPLTLAPLVAASPGHAVTAHSSQASIRAAFHANENEPDENEPDENEPDGDKTGPRRPTGRTPTSPPPPPPPPPRVARPRTTHPKSGTPSMAGRKKEASPQCGSNPAVAATSGSSGRHGLPIALAAGGLALAGFAIGATAATRRRRPS